MLEVLAHNTLILMPRIFYIFSQVTWRSFSSQEITTEPTTSPQIKDKYAYIRKPQREQQLALPNVQLVRFDLNKFPEHGAANPSIKHLIRC